jgi:hypothetical protein
MMEGFGAGSVAGSVRVTRGSDADPGGLKICGSGSAIGTDYFRDFMLFGLLVLCTDNSFW